MNNTDVTPRPLAGVRVVSLAEQYPGPFATLILSDLGADVVQVERPGTGDPARAFPAFYAALNRGKRSIALDLKQEQDRTTCRDLIDRADVVLEGFRPGVMERLGLGPEKVLADRPDLVYVSISGFGQDGPYRTRPGHDLSFQAVAGLVSPSAPQMPTSPLADSSSGLFAVIAALAGLNNRARTGRGGHWDVSMLESLISMSTSTMGPAVNGAADSLLGQDPGYGLFAGSGGTWLSLSVAFEDHFWATLCDVLDLPALREVPAAQRVARRDEVRAALADRIAIRDARELDAELTAAGVPCGVVNGPEDVRHDVHVAVRDVFQVLSDGPDRTVYVRQPLIVDGARLGPRRGAPGLGEHTDEIRTELAAGQSGE